MVVVVKFEIRVDGNYKRQQVEVSTLLTFRSLKTLVFRDCSMLMYGSLKMEICIL